MAGVPGSGTAPGPGILVRFEHLPPSFVRLSASEEVEEEEKRCFGTPPTPAPGKHRGPTHVGLPQTCHGEGSAVKGLLAFTKETFFKKTLKVHD